MVRILRGLSTQERRHLGMMFAFIGLLHAVGWGVLLLVVVPQHLSVGGTAFGVALGATAYFLGIRHAFDVDHIAAIDNTTRLLMERRTRPISVGFWFALGHSSVVFVLCALMAGGVRSILGPLAGNGSPLREVAGTVGMTVSGLFLIVLGLLNVSVLLGIARVFRRLRAGEAVDVDLHEVLAQRGMLARLLLRVTDSVRTPRHMFPVGVLFGLGLDTWLSLLGLAGAGAAYDLPWYALLCLPILFAAGMCLFDTIDGTYMNFAYGWAFSNPVRKIYYNFAVTTLSVAVAWLVGGLELLSVRGVELTVPVTGYVVVALFVVLWAASVGVWKYGRIEERWTVPDSA